MGIVHLIFKTDIFKKKKFENKNEVGAHGIKKPRKDMDSQSLRNLDYF